MQFCAHAAETQSCGDGSMGTPEAGAVARDHVTWAGEEDASKPRTEEWVEVSEWGGSEDQCVQNGKEHEPNPEVRRECGIFRDVCVDGGTPSEALSSDE